MPCSILYPQSQLWLRHICTNTHTSATHLEAYTEPQSTGFPGPAKPFLRIPDSHAYVCLNASRARKLSVSQTATRLAQAWGSTLKGKVTVGG